MTGNFKRLLLLLAFLQMFTLVQSARADTGPKPSMEFQFIQEAGSEPLTILAGILYECREPDCSDAVPLEEVGPQGFNCGVDQCYAVAYGFAPYHQIEIEFSDEITRQSNIFETAGFESVYSVTVRPEDLLVEAQFNLGRIPPLTTAVILICGCLLVIGVLLVTLVLFLVRRSRAQ